MLYHSAGVNVMKFGWKYNATRRVRKQLWGKDWDWELKTALGIEADPLRAGHIKQPVERGREP